MPFVNDRFCIEFGFAANNGMSYKYLTKVTTEYRQGKSKSYANYPDPADGRKVLIEFDSIPETQLAKIKQSVAVEYKQKADFDLKEFLIALEADNKLKKAFQDYKKYQQALVANVMSHYSSKPESYNVAEALSDEALWYLMLGPIKNKTAKNQGFSSVDLLYQEAMKIMRNTIPHFKSNNLRYFKDRMSPFKQLFKQDISTEFDPEELAKALESLIHGNKGKGYTAKLHSANGHKTRQMLEMQAEIVRLYSDPVKLSFYQTWQSYIITANKQHTLYHATEGAKGWDARCFIDETTIRHFLLTPDIKQEWYAKRHGQNLADNVFEKITSRQSASYANLKWVIDGTPWHRYYMDGNYAYQRINVFVVLDAFSYSVVGFYVSRSENADQVLGALRAACILGNYLPKEIQFDNSSAIQSHRVQHAIDTIAKYGVPTRVGNARSKKVEHFFAELNDKVLKFRKGYTGNPFAKLERQPNRDHLQQMIKTKQLPDWNQAVKDLYEDFTRWNKGIEYNGAIPSEKYWASVETTKDLQVPYTKAIELEAFYYLPMEKNKKLPQEYTFTNNGIVVKRDHPMTLEPQVVRFDTEDPEFNSRFIGQKFLLRCEPEKMDEAYLYLPDGKPFYFNGEHYKLTPPIRQKEAIGDREEGDGSRLWAHLETKKEQRKLAESRLKSRIELTKEAGTYKDGIEWSDVYGKNHLTSLQIETNEALLNPPKKEIETTETKKISRFSSRLQ